MQDNLSAESCPFDVMASFLGSIFLLLLVAAESRELTDSDLARAHRPKPLGLRFALERDVSSALNAALSTAWTIPTKPCESFDLEELHSLIDVLAAVRDADLQDIYGASGDRRSLPDWLATSASRRGKRAADGAAPSDALRAARCNDAAFLFAHHLGAEARREAAAVLAAAPLVRELPPASGDAYGALELAGSMSCRACHYVDDLPANASHPVATPDNYNTTMYMYAESHGSSIADVDYRYPLRQALYTTTWAEKAHSRDCSLLFESDGSVWEWYRDSEICAKLMDGAPVFPPDMARGARMTELVAEAPLVVLNPFTNASMPPCRLYCAPGDGPCYCESLVEPFQPVLHTHTSRNLSGSRSYYGPYVPTPGDFAPIARPAYCPGADAPAKFANDTTGLECSCNRCWV